MVTIMSKADKLSEILKIYEELVFRSQRLVLYYPEDYDLTELDVAVS